MENPNQTTVTNTDKESAKQDKVTRRGFLGIGSAVLTAAGIVSAVCALGQEKPDRSRSDPGPTNPVLDGQNPDSALPPSTDSKSLVQTFKYPFSFANKRVYEGGW